MRVFACFKAYDPGTRPSAPPVAQGAPAGILAGVHDALARLVNQGTINQQQADAVQQQANNGSIDPTTLTQSGTVSDAQMRVIADAIDELKQAYGR